MNIKNNEVLTLIRKSDINPLSFEGNFGLEKENLRVDEQGNLALSPHPKEFGDKLRNPYIKTDFSESQIELITPVCKSIEEAYEFLGELQDFVSVRLTGEYLWPQSNLPKLPEEEQIPIARYGKEGYKERKYRERLAKKYGKKLQLLSGVHFNFSLKEEFLNKLYARLEHNKSYQEFKNDIYLKITKYLLKYRWLLIYLTGASPTLKTADNLGCYCKDFRSLRNSSCGYSNNEELYISYETIEDYVASLQASIDQGKIQNINEFYSPVRIKGRGKGTLEELLKQGIQYLELRLFDLNPFDKNGISKEDLYFTRLLITYLLVKADFTFGTMEQKMANTNHEQATLAERPENIGVFDELGQWENLQEEATKIINELEELIEVLGGETEYFSYVINTAREKVLKPEKTYALRIIEGVKQSSYVQFHIDLAKKHLEESKKK
ncbi:bifunctional glutamate--cysteine ligase GshA/glutathione synthetase GshB [Natranaerobius thermophilus]|nr:bifunctional glutamate--cysteine ligase GshA/glutathione synthetase GshB [Natranaerobius thermophilus]